MSQGQHSSSTKSHTGNHNSNQNGQKIYDVVIIGAGLSGK